MNPTLRAAFDWVNSELAREAARLMDEAKGWILLVEDLEFGSLSLHGPFDDPVSASEAAARWKEELNRFNADNDIGWEVTVYPLQPRPFPEIGESKETP